MAMTLVDLSIVPNNPFIMSRAPFLETRIKVKIPNQENTFVALSATCVSSSVVPVLLPMRIDPNKTIEPNKETSRTECKPYPFIINTSAVACANRFKKNSVLIGRNHSAESESC